MSLKPGAWSWCTADGLVVPVARPGFYAQTCEDRNPRQALKLLRVASVFGLGHCGAVDACWLEI